jgi:hypothetical protein
MLTTKKALGIAEEVAQLNLKGNKRKKGKKLDEDFTVIIFLSSCLARYLLTG